MKKLIEIAKNMRKQAYLTKKYKQNYAFVGIGSHSINNLYPVLNYLQVSLKYIVTRTEKNAAKINTNFTGVIGISNYDEVLNDNEINGIFICANPTAHFNLVKQALDKGKNVFVEKPACSNISELNQLINAEKNGASCLVGMQKRYAPSYSILKKKMKDPLYYSYKYVTGTYPEGEEILDLFIHPIDVAVFLFGDATVQSCKKITNSSNDGITYLLHLVHNSGVAGSLELSTDYAWSFAKESLTVNTQKGIFTSENCVNLQYHTKPSTILNIPLEKVKGFAPQVTTLYEQNSFLPVREHNQIYSAGYFNEITSFLDMCEGTAKPEQLKTTLKNIVGTYQIIEQIKSAK